MAFKLIELLFKGAEAEIWKGEWFNNVALFKIRKSKSWRHPVLDRRIIESRTLKEARIIYAAFQSDIDVPFIYDVDLAKATIVMEFVEGITLKEILSNRDPRFFKLCEDLGYIVAKMHNSSIIHGDLTTSNVILRKDGQLCLIDFGLSEFSNRIEDKGSDLHLFLRALESSFASIAIPCFEAFKRGYSKIAEDYEEVFDKIKEIRRRGRYVLERRVSKKI